MAHDSVSACAVSFDTHPSRYRHWRLRIDGGVATLTLAVDIDGGLRPGYPLKLNSYDLGVDIELADAIRRLRFEHPSVRCVVLTGGVPKMFCAGANIRMLATSSHTWKVNFCKFTNETRCEIEDATAHSGQRYIAACNGTAAGGGYELAEACAEIYLIDDGFSAVSLPEVPLLGVLPGTGGLTRLVDKRKVRRDIADLFCTKAEGFRLRDALKMRLVDGGFAKSKWEAGVAERAAAVVAEAGGVRSEHGIGLEPLDLTRTSTPEAETFAWPHVTLDVHRAERKATLTVQGPDSQAPESADDLHKQGCQAWAVAAFRALDAALLELRFNHPNVGLILLQTHGSAPLVLAHDTALTVLRAQGDWLAREIQLFQARTLRRLDNMARSLYALIEPGSCFAGSLLEMAWAADRSYMLADPDSENSIALHIVNKGALPTWNGMNRLAIRLMGEPELLQAAFQLQGPIDAEQAERAGLVTRAPDDIDGADEVRLAIEERVSFSPDALTGMEQNLRLAGPESVDTKLYGRLTAWQNWIFQRPNAVGERGALTMYGNPQPPVFDWTRT